MPFFCLQSAPWVHFCYVKEHTLAKDGGGRDRSGPVVVSKKISEVSGTGRSTVGVLLRSSSGSPGIWTEL